MALFKLITEGNSPNYTAIKDIVLREETAADGTKKKVTEIVGPFVQCDVQNRNGRIYPKELMIQSVQKYVDDRMKGPKLRTFGELGHPEGVELNLHRVSHLVTNLDWDGNNVIGRAKILDTEYGRIAETILRADGQLGVSSRGLGSLNQPNQNNSQMYEASKVKFGENANIVTEYELLAIDIVADPSAPQGFVNGILESKEYIISGGEYTESSLKRSTTAYKNLEESLRSLPKKDAQKYIISKIENFLKSI